MFSQFWHVDVVDTHQRHAVIVDAVVDTQAESYPRVTHLLVCGHSIPQQLLSWDAVQACDWRMDRVTVTDLTRSQPLAEASQPEIRLGRDVLDAFIIDLSQRRVTRANDIWLEETVNGLRVRAVDTGLYALWRRLWRGRLQGTIKNSLLDWQFVDFLHGDPQAVPAGMRDRRRITQLPPGEIAALTALLPYVHTAELLMGFPAPLAADVLEHMSPERQLQVFEELAEEHGLQVLTAMAPDVAADLLGRMCTADAQRYLEHVPMSCRSRLIELLRYPEDTVGGVMTNDVVVVPSMWTVSEARMRLRVPLQTPDFVYFVYVVDHEETRRLRGVITLRELLTAGATRRIDEIMNPYVLTLSPLENATAAAYRVLQSHIAALPVIGHDRQVLGVMTVDMAVAQVVPGSFSGHVPRIFS